MFRKETQWESECDVCHGTKYVGVIQKGDGYEFIECEKCHGTGVIQVYQYGFSKDEDDE